MTLLKTSILSFIATAVRMMAGLVINKAIAVYIGPSGLALIGQFQNFMQLVMALAQGAINGGVTKYTAEYGRESKKIPVLFSASAKISLLSSVIVGLSLILFSEYASVWFLGSDSYGYVFVLFGFTIVLYVINNLLLSILNGLKEIKTWVAVNIIQSFYGLVFTTLLVVFWGVDGALIALVTNQSFVLIVVLFMLRKHQVIKLSNFKGAFDSSEGKKLAGFAMMALTTALMAPVSHLIVRDHIGENLGWDAAGYWQAVWYISTMYLTVVTMALSTYYLPRLSEIADKVELRKELWQGYITVMPVVIVMAVAIFFLKDFIIWLLFSDDFMLMRDLFLWQLIGDVFKLASWLISYLMIAKAMTKIFIFTEVFFNVSFVFLSIFFVGKFGLLGVSYSFALSYVFYFVVVLCSTKKMWS